METLIISNHDSDTFEFKLNEAIHDLRSNHSQIEVQFSTCCTAQGVVMFSALIIYKP